MTQNITRRLNGTLEEKKDYLERWETDAEEPHLKTIWLAPSQSIRLAKIGSKGVLAYFGGISASYWFLERFGIICS